LSLADVNKGDPRKGEVASEFIERRGDVTQGNEAGRVGHDVGPQRIFGADQKDPVKLTYR